MTDFSESFRELVETKFQTEFTLLYPAMLVQWDDIPFKQPDNEAWAAFTFMQNPTKQASIGNRFVARTTGFIQIDITRSEDKGTADLRRIAEKAADIFAFKKFGTASVTASFSEKHVTTAPASKGFKRIMARVFFYYDGTETR